MIKSKKLLRGAIVSAIAACMLTIGAFAYTGTGVVHVSTYLNVRQSSSTSSAIIGKLYNGTKVNIVDSTTGWYKISYNGTTGWVSGSYVTIDSSTSVQTVVNTAKSVIGTKFVFGAASPSTGFDCSGLTMYAYSKVGIALPHSAAMQSTMGTWVAKSNLRPGDLIFFDTAGSGKVTHVGMYIGNDTFIQAESGVVQKVTTTSLSNSYWSRVYITARRYIQ